MRKKTITIGPLADGQDYRYDLGKKRWYDQEGPVDFLPFECMGLGGRMETFHFHTESHKWTTDYGLILPNEQSDNIDYAFRKRYGLNGEVKLLTLENRSRCESEPEGIPGPTKEYDIAELDVQAFQEGRDPAYKADFF